MTSIASVFSCAVTVRKEITPPRDLDDVFGGTNKRHRVQTGIQCAADHAFAAHRPRHGGDRDRRPNPGKRRGYSTRKPRTRPTGDPIRHRHPVHLCNVRTPIRPEALAKV